LISGNPSLLGAPLEAVRQSVFKPTLVNGQRVEVVTAIDVNFVLKQP